MFCRFFWSVFSDFLDQIYVYHKIHKEFLIIQTLLITLQLQFQENLNKLSQVARADSSDGTSSDSDNGGKPESIDDHATDSGSNSDSLDYELIESKAVNRVSSKKTNVNEPPKAEPKFRSSKRPSPAGVVSSDSDSEPSNGLESQFMRTVEN